MERLVLFDIDGTLLSTDGAAARAFRWALEEIFGTSGPISGYSFAGRTDPQIARDLLLMAGVDEDVVREGMPRVWPLYETRLQRELREVDVVRYPGVVELLERIEPDPGILPGLLTGNILAGARLKLDWAGIGFERFRIGAFGSDHHDRRELPGIAVRRAADAVGHQFEGKSVVIIGDTPLDIACGAHLGVRTIAVATGSYTRDELLACGPDHAFENLSDTEAVRSAILD